MIGNSLPPDHSPWDHFWPWALLVFVIYVLTTMREFPASPMQVAVYAGSLDSMPGTAANTQVSINFGETVEILLVRKAWKWLTQYHGLLRSSFKRTIGGALTLREHEDCEIAWRVLDWTKVPLEEIGGKWSRLQKEDAAEAIDPSKPPLYRFHIIELPGGICHLLWTFHSILFDEESVSLILRDWLKIINLLCKNQALPIPQGALSYVAIIGAIDGADPETTKKYWENTFEGFSSWCPLQPIYSYKHSKPSAAIPPAHIEFLMNRGVAAYLNQLAATANVSLLTILKAAWGLVLARTTVDTETIFGVYRSCRSLAGSQASEAVGLFDSLLPVRVKIPEDLTCKEWLQQLQKEEAASSPYWLMDAEASWSNLPGSFPRLDSTLHYLPLRINDRIPAEMPEWMRFDARIQRVSPFPIQLIVHGVEQLAINLEYNSNQVSSTIARQLLDRFLHVLESFEENVVVSEISITLPNEKEGLIKLGSSTPNTSSPNHFFALLEQLARESADLPAVEKESKTLSFSLLDAHSQQLATFLKNHSQNAKSVVALAISPSQKMLVGLLGILRAGCICFLLDPSALPSDLKKTLAHHKVSAILTETSSTDALSKTGRPCFALDEIWDQITSFASHVSFPFPQAEDPALFLAHPNGERTLISHGALQASLEKAIRIYDVKPGDRILCHSLLGSAASLEECLIPVLAGATLVIPGKNTKSTRTAFQEAAESNQITHLRITAAFWSQWVHYLYELNQPPPANLRRVLIEAGHISYPIIEGWKKLNNNKVRCVVFYSSSGFAGMGVATEEAGSPEFSNNGLVCGRPQPGTLVFISDRAFRPLPPLFPGLLLLGNVEMPPEKNVVTLSTSSEKWQVSDTKEHARWNEQGQLVLASQPHHILPENRWKELNRIQNALTSHPDLIDALVRVSSKGTGQGALQAWIVPRDSHEQFPSDLEDYLKDLLPKDQIPSFFALVTRFPLNAFDQVDIAALPQPGPIPPSKPKIAPSTIITVAPSTSHTALSPITTLHASVLDTALYFIHAGRGLVEDYRPVVQALSDGYAIHCVTVPRGHSGSSTTIQEITRQLTPALRMHASGKFAVVGIGAGAVFAWELAHQLDRKTEKEVPFVFFEIPSTGLKEPTSWLDKLKRAALGNEKAPYAPHGRLAKMVAAYEPPVLQRRPYFFVSGKPDPEWRRRAPFGVWGQLRLAGTALLDEPEEIAEALKRILAPHHSRPNSVQK